MPSVMVMVASRPASGLGALRSKGNAKYANRQGCLALRDAIYKRGQFCPLTAGERVVCEGGRAVSINPKRVEAALSSELAVNLSVVTWQS
jgi:hypothetical protein